MQAIDVISEPASAQAGGRKPHVGWGKGEALIAKTKSEKASKEPLWIVEPGHLRIHAEADSE